MLKLYPCRLCGSAPKIITAAQFKCSDAFTRFNVVCPFCDHYDGLVFPSLSEAILEWNNNNSVMHYA